VLARPTAQANHAKMKAAGHGAHSPFLLDRQMTVQDENVEPMLLGESEEGRTDELGELRRHLERPEAGKLRRASRGRRVGLRMRCRRQRREDGEGNGEKK
jgi:hypothetical protein